MTCGRRKFLETAASGALLAAGIGSGFSLAPALAAPPQSTSNSLPGHPARFYKKLPGKRVECELCAKRCRVDDTERGFCGVRENHGGDYRTLVWGRACAMNLDPIEKKPLFHFCPGAWTFSIATAGCNMDCKACQNWQISQSRPEQVRSVDLPPQKVVEATKHAGSRIVTYTYTEPVVFLEYVLDTAAVARKAGMKNCMVTGGNIEVAPLKEACAAVDAIKVDLKSFSENTYEKMCKGQLKTVLRTVENIRKFSCWLEIVYLVIPTVNDSAQELRAASQWIKANLGPDVPLHFTRFHPDYQLKHLPPTPYETLRRAFEIGREQGLHFVYVGNIPSPGAEDTLCPKCKRVLITRRGFSVTGNKLDQGKCSGCHTVIPGVWG